jgi:FAD/FMN-containing dehydrogenase
VLLTVPRYNLIIITFCINISGQSKVVLKPKTTHEVSKILSYCNEKGLAICPQGGNTGLVGGSVPVFDEIVINFMLMNKVISLDEISGKTSN